jgi:hypothetical protein
MRIPQNYSGSAFRPTAEEGNESPSDLPSPYEPPPLFEPRASAPPHPSDGEDRSEASELTQKEDSPTSSSRLTLRSLFSGSSKEGSGLGSEELLLLALLLLFWGNDGADDLPLLLLLLLMIK